MILNELFQHDVKVEKLDPTDPIMERHGHWAEAYALYGEHQDILFFFVHLGGTGVFQFNFASLSVNHARIAAMSGTSMSMDYEPTGNGNPFMVYAAAAKVIRNFIATEQPRRLHIEPATEDQGRLYTKALNRAVIPPGYRLVGEPMMGFSIVRDDDPYTRELDDDDGY